MGDFYTIILNFADCIARSPLRRGGFRRKYEYTRVLLRVSWRTRRAFPRATLNYRIFLLTELLHPVLIPNRTTVRD